MFDLELNESASGVKGDVCNIKGWLGPHTYSSPFHCWTDYFHPALPVTPSPPPKQHFSLASFTPIVLTLKTAEG